MADMNEHRLYKHMSEPVRIVGLTIDELVLGAGGFLGSMMFCSDMLFSVILMIGSLVSVAFLKKAKKKLKTTHMKSLLYWHGLWPRPSKSYPKFHNREYRR